MCNTIEEALTMAKVGERAGRLFTDGYCATWKDTSTLLIVNPTGQEYEIDTQQETCTCPFFTSGEGARPCKHVLGYRQLLDDQTKEAALYSPPDAAALNTRVLVP